MGNRRSPALPRLLFDDEAFEQLSQAFSAWDSDADGGPIATLCEHRSLLGIVPMYPL